MCYAGFYWTAWRLCSAWRSRGCLNWLLSLIAVQCLNGCLQHEGEEHFNISKDYINVKCSSRGWSYCHFLQIYCSLPIWNRWSYHQQVRRPATRMLTTSGCDYKLALTERLKCLAYDTFLLSHINQEHMAFGVTLETNTFVSQGPAEILMAHRHGTGWAGSLDEMMEVLRPWGRLVPHLLTNALGQPWVSSLGWPTSVCRKPCMCKLVCDEFIYNGDCWMTLADMGLRSFLSQSNFIM